MKRTLLLVALLAVMPLANAQDGKNYAAVRSAVAAAEKNAENPKKATNVATWTKLAECYMDAYQAPMGSIILGMDRNELKLLLNNIKPTSTETVQIQGQNFTKEVYPTVNLYFSEAGQLQMTEVTEQAVENSLSKALEAYKKAAQVDEKGKKSGDIVAGIKKIGEYFNVEATNAYYFNNIEKASELFESAAKAVAGAPVNGCDSLSLYNAGFTAWMGGNNDRAKEIFEQCKAIGYYGTDGEIFAKLADIANKAKDAAAEKAALEEGFAKFPQSQSIIIGLINYYINSGEDPAALFQLLEKARQNEPDNASLYSVEGQIREKLGETEKALEAYHKCAEVDPKYPYGYTGAGLLYYNKADAIAQEAQSLGTSREDIRKYDELIKEWEVALANALPEFQKAYEVAQDAALKADIAKFVKDIAFRLRSVDPKYAELYEQFQKIVEGN